MQFQRRQLATTYDLSFNQKVPPQTQVNSFYEPQHALSSKEFHRDTVPSLLFSSTRRTTRR